MILMGDILEGIREQLECYLDPTCTEVDPNAGDDVQPDHVVLGNVALVDAFTPKDPNIQDNVIMSVVNVEEEKALRYSKTQTLIQRPDPNDSQIVTHHPVIFINLYILFGSNNSSYRIALNEISSVINFFQRQHVFTNEQLASIPEEVERVVFELCTTSFEQLNHLWGVLGGKYIPSVLYKVRILPHEDIRLESGSGRILRERANSIAN